ncbi:hypothetical protein HanPSC8_Chr07g0278881 [Helianthus annuus]|nr:hypothetical protein HanPSC8_Chr07g0278881 [Helianthus annuus]
MHNVLLIKKKHGITLIRVSDFSSHSYPPPSLSLGDSETPSIPTTRQSSVFQTCAGFVNDGGCGWKMMTLVGGQIGTILTRSTFLFGICVIASFDG